MASFCTLEDYKKQLVDITLDDDFITEALEHAAQKIKNIVFIKTTFETLQPRDEFLLETPIADSNMDGSIDESDIFLIELDDDYEEINQNSHISSFKSKYGYIKTDTDLPETSGNKLIIEYYVAKFQNSEMTDLLKNLNILMANDYMFSNIPFEKLQNGISDWNLNGVSVRFDASSINQIKEENTKKIDELLNHLTPYYSKTTKFGMDNDDRASSYVGRYKFR